MTRLTGTEWGRTFAGLLAEQPAMVDRLLVAHVEVRGRCAGCHTPGTGTPGAVWPCPLHELAAQAERIHERRLGHPRGSR